MSSLYTVESLGSELSHTASVTGIELKLVGGITSEAATMLSTEGDCWITISLMPIMRKSDPHPPRDDIPHVGHCNGCDSIRKSDLAAKHGLRKGPANRRLSLESTIGGSVLTGA